ncbi:MAG: macro domain-containing protein [Planctomycetes bacterium]|nr:macro domain-containing protein [Planctomycetota bacterium]
MIVFIRGDLFKSRCEALLNPINCTPAMGKGLALEFRRTFPGLYEHHQRQVAAGMVHPGALTFFRPRMEGRLIVGMPTKRHWRDGSRLEDVVAGIEALRAFLDEPGSPASIAIPAIGCGLGGLRWDVVKELLRKAFEDHSKVVHAYEP